MSAQVTISQLPVAGTITGTELVPVVQNGVTVQTTTGAIAASPSQTQTFLTVNNEPTLPNSRYVGVTDGLVQTDNGPQGLFNISTTGALLSLNSSPVGIQTKTTATDIVGRSITSLGAGLSVANGSGVAGNPQISLTGQVAGLANLSADGLLTLNTSGTLGATQITGTGNQIVVVNGNGVGGNPTVSLADNAVMPGTSAMTVVTGTSAQQPSGYQAQFRFNSDTQTFDGYAAGAWRQFSASGGVIAFSAGTTGFTPSTATSGSVTLGGTLNFTNGGTNSTDTPTAGGAIYGTGSAYAITAAGTVGYVLTSAGASAPVWSGISGGTF